MFKHILKSASYNLQSIPGKRVDEKIIIIESDDWGSIRMSSKRAYNSLLDKGIPVNKSFYNKYDSLASSEDLENLFHVLSKYKDKLGNSPVITANTIVANPDFERIRQDNFEKYHYELFTDTLKKYSNTHQNSFDLWKEGIKSKVFIPQFHGREHLNYKRWLSSLKQGNKDAVAAFDENVFGYPLDAKSPFYTNYMAAFDIDNENDINDQVLAVQQGLEIFKEVIGYPAESFIAPNYIWHDAIEQAVAKQGIKQLQSGLYQFKPSLKKEQYKKVMHYIGQKNKYGLSYSVRNAFFEPSFSTGTDWVNNCLHRVDVAFKWKKPAIICSHRVNYIGAIEKSNRDNSLRQLDVLLKKITQKWPEAIFISSNQLNDYLNGK
jgi:hypothetical protein